MPDDSNLYQRRPGGPWWLRVKVGGRDIRESLRTRHKAEARKRRDERLAALSHVAFHGEERHTWQQAVGRWLLEYLPGNVSVGTAARYQVSIGQVVEILEPLYVDEISRKTIAKLISEAKRRGATNATIRRDLTAVSSVLSCCVAWGWRDDNPAREFDRSIIRERREPIRPPDDADVNAFAAWADLPPMIGRLVLFLRQTGMREAEAVYLERSQIDHGRKAVQLTKTKTNRPRVVELSEAAVGTLKGTPAHHRSAYVFWHGPDGEPYRNFASRFAELMRRAVKEGVVKRRFRCHDLRHAFAVEHLREHGDIYRTSRTLGHTSVKTTETFYLGFVGEGAQIGAHQRRSDDDAEDAAKVPSA